MKEVFVLLTDSDGMMRSKDEPFGYAVTSEEQAKRFAKLGGYGYSHSYQRLLVFDTPEEVKTHYHTKNA